MSKIADFCNQIGRLASLGGAKEEAFRLTLQGRSFDSKIRENIEATWKHSTILGISPPILQIEGDQLGPEDVDDLDAFYGKAWEVRIGKEEVCKKLPSRSGGEIFLFFSELGFASWVQQLDPLSLGTALEIDFTRPTTIHVYGLKDAFGGPSLWIVPLEWREVAPPGETLPDANIVHGLIHIHTEASPLIVNPNGFALTWGSLKSVSAKALLQKTAWALAASVVQEIRRTSTGYEIVLRGTKRVTAPLTSGSDPAIESRFLALLTETVKWVYEERPETRLKLIMDRLSIDLQGGESLMQRMQEGLADALQQAKDSYTFVILERKDAYHKELREILKDMRAQADLYAAKVRDLISALTRDIVAVLALIGFSFLGKFDTTTLTSGINSVEFGWLTIVLATYLILSFALQASAYLRDVVLSYQESQSWLKVLQNYTSRADNDERFTAPIKRRRTTLFWALGIIGLLYIALAIAVIKIPFIVGLLHKHP